MADALLQVLGGLVREREAQDVARKHPGLIRGQAAERHQREVHDAGGHHGRLARARARDEHERLQRPRDGTPLLVGGRSTAEDVDDLLRVGRRRAHVDAPAPDPAGRTSNNGRPSGNNGQRDWNSQKKQSAW